MKKASLFIITALCIAVPELSAQRYLPGQQGLQVTAGTVNGLNPKENFHAGIAFSQYYKACRPVGVRCGIPRKTVFL
jgi:hypothetical protein